MSARDGLATKSIPIGPPSEIPKQGGPLRAGRVHDRPQVFDPLVQGRDP